MAWTPVSAPSGTWAGSGSVTTYTDATFLADGDGYLLGDESGLAFVEETHAGDAWDDVSPPADGWTRVF